MKYMWHWNPVHAGAMKYPIVNGYERELFAQTPHDVIKIITNDNTIPHLDSIPDDARILVRNMPMTEGFGDRHLTDTPQAVLKGERSAVVCDQIATWAELHGVNSDRLIFSGLNEPQLWSGESYSLVADYYLSFLVNLHRRGLHGVVGEFGAGWPPTRTDNSINFDTFRPVWYELGSRDAYAYHAYWGGGGVAFWYEWLAGRMSQRPEWMHGKKIWLTECGSANVQPNTTDGWRRYSTDNATAALRYVNELNLFRAMLINDTDIEYGFIFTLDGAGSDWANYDLRQEDFMRLHIPFLQSPSTPPTPPAIAIVPLRLRALAQEVNDLADFVERFIK